MEDGAIVKPGLTESCADACCRSTRALTRGSIRTFPATAETENTRSCQGGVWLGKQDSNQSMHFICIAFSRRKTRAKLRRVRSGEFAAPTCGFHRHLCRTCSLRSWDDAAIAFGVIYEASTAPCGSNAFHAPSKRKLAIAPVGNFPPADASSLFKSAWASSSARSCRAGL
jgi:hypothetical protein